MMLFWDSTLKLIAGDCFGVVADRSTSILAELLIPLCGKVWEKYP